MTAMNINEPSLRGEERRSNRMRLLRPNNGLAMTLKLGFVLILILQFLPSLMGADPHAFPVPFVAKKHQNISFTNLPQSGTIKIFNMVGEKVVELSIPLGAGIRSWNVKNDEGDNVATGVYFFSVSSGNQKTTGKLVIIR